MNWAAPIASAAAVAVIPLILLVCRKLFPYRPKLDEPPITPEQWETLNGKHLWVNLALILPTFAFAAVLFCAWTLLLLGLDNWCLSRLPLSRYVVKPGLVVWMSPGLFLGIITAGLPIDLLCRLMLRRNYSEYLRIEALRYGFDGKKLFLFLAIPVVIICGVFAGLACDWYLQVTDDYIAWNRLWSFTEHHYDFTEVDKLIEVPEERDAAGNVKHWTQYFIVFGDGAVWRSDETGTGVVRAWETGSDEYLHEMLEFLECKTGKRIIHAQSIEGLLP